MTIFTVGHSTRSEDEFMAILRAHGIRRLVDVRRYPGSRRYPHFSRESLQHSLPEQGVEYVHEPALGGRRTGAADSVNTGWRSASFRAYADYMATTPFEEAVGRLLDGAVQGPTAIMCAEAVPWRCHRQLIADVLVARGHDVHNILSAERAEAHRLSGHASVDEHGAVTYPGTPADSVQTSLFRRRL